MLWTKWPNATGCAAGRFMNMPSPSRTDRQRAERGGRRAEFFAALCLMAQLFMIVARRVKTPVGEIDLIARRGRLAVFVEVKQRGAGRDEHTALESVNQQRIVRAAAYYIARHPELADRDVRFDVIFLAPWTWPRHVRDAFAAN